MDDRAPPDAKTAPRGCKCQFEAGDSPCPVHGDDDDRPAAPSAKTLPLTMPDQLSRELAEARQKLASLELLAKLREHHSCEWLIEQVAEEARCPGGWGEVNTLLLELLRGAL